MKLTLTFTLFLCLFYIAEISSQVSIGTGATARKGTLLDLRENNNSTDNSSKGMLLPRVELEGVHTLKPCADESADPDISLVHLGLTVYNLTTDLPKGLCTGVYIWAGITSGWQRMGDDCPEAPRVPSLAIDPKTWDVPSTGETKTFTVTSNVPWTLTKTDANNIVSSITPMSGDAGKTTVTMVASSTTEYPDYTARVTVKPTDAAISLSDGVDIVRSGACDYYTLGNWEIYCVDLPFNFTDAVNYCKTIVPKTRPEVKFVPMELQHMWATIYEPVSVSYSRTLWVTDQTQQQNPNDVLVAEIAKFSAAEGGHTNITTKAVPRTSIQHVRCLRPAN